jgi:proteic killer suppression protein
MNAAENVSEIGLFPGWRLHRLHGDREGQWAITITRNWRIVFETVDDEIVNVDFEDYH